MSVGCKKVFGTVVFVIMVIMLLLLFAGTSLFSQNPAHAFEDGYEVSDAVIDEIENEAVFTVSRSFTDTVASINYRTVSLTAFEGVHFTPLQGTLEFNIGEDEKEIAVPITDANQQYSTYQATQYTNIDKDFYLEIYNPSDAIINRNFGQATLTKDMAFEVEKEIFEDFLRSSIYPINAMIDYGETYTESDVTAPLEGYYDAVCSGYYFNITVEYGAFGGDPTLSEFMVALMPQGSTNIPTYAESLYIVTMNDGKYVVLFDTDNTQITSFDIPVRLPPSAGMTIYDGHSTLSESDSALLSDAAFGYDLYIENRSSGTTGQVLSFTEFDIGIKANDTSAPSLVGASQFSGQYRDGDDLYISLVFDEIISEEQSNLLNSYFTSNGSNFYYHSGAGSNVLVYQGQVFGSIVDEVELLTFEDGSIKDFSGNEASFDFLSGDYTFPIEIEMVYDYTVEHYKVNSSGSFDLVDSDVYQDTEGTTVYASSNSYSGYVTVDTPQTVDSGVVLTDGSLTLELYYMLSEVYLGGSGSDLNDGATDTTAVATFAAAKNMLAEDGVMFIVDTITISDEQAWDLTGYSQAVIVRLQKPNALINIASGGKLTLTNVTIDGAKDYLGSGSGTLINVADGGELNLGLSSVLQNNDSTSNTDGGAINNSGTLNILGGTITNNKSSLGGAVFNNPAGNIYMTDGNIDNNTANNGGGIYNLEGTIDLTKGTITLNTALSSSGGGGGIYTTTGELVLNGSEVIIFQNGAMGGSTSKGGGIFATGSAGDKGELIINNAVIENNTAAYGGGIYITENSYLYVANGMIKENTAYYGGGIYSASLPLIGFDTFVGGLIDDNYASENGGGLYLFGGEFLMNGGQISNNESDKDGGGVYVDLNGEFTLKDGNITNNTASGTGSIGGGIINYGTINLEGGQMSGNTYQTYGFIGGGVANSGVFYLDGDNADIDDIIHFVEDDPVLLTAIPTDERVYEIFYATTPIDTVLDTVCVEGYLVNAGDAKDNFDVLNIGVLLSEDNGDLILKEAVTIYFNSNGGTGSMSPQYAVEGETIALSSNRFARFNHDFLGWSTNNEATSPNYYDEDDYVVPASDVTLYAIWLKIIPKWQDSSYVGSSFAGGSGTEEAPYQINSASQLAYLAQLVNQGNITYSQRHYILTDNIDLSANSFPGEDYIIWVPIGVDAESFRGSFDGDGYEISGLFVDVAQSAFDNFGLFGNISHGAIIKNVGLVDASFEMDVYETGFTIENINIGGIVNNATNASLINVYVENISIDLETTGGTKFGPLMLYAENITLENYYILNPSVNVIGGINLCALGLRTGSEHIAIGYYYSDSYGIYNYDVNSFPSGMPTYEDLYDASVNYNATELKSGRDLRFYYWEDSVDNFPRLQKLDLLQNVYLQSGTTRELGQSIVHSFDEAMMTLKKGGYININDDSGVFNVTGDELWTLPENIYGYGYVKTQNPQDSTAFIVSGQLTLRDIAIDPDHYDIIENQGTLIVEEGSFIAGRVRNFGTIEMYDNLMNTLMMNIIICEDTSEIVVYETPYTEVTLFTSALDSGYPLITGGGALDISLYKNMYYVEYNRVLLPENDYLAVYTVMDEVYLDVDSVTDGAGTELDPVNNIDKALEVVNPSNGIIYMMEKLYVTQPTEWDFTGYNITLQQYDTIDTLFDVAEGVTLTLTNVNIETPFSVAEVFGKLVLQQTTINIIETFLTAIILSEQGELEIDGASQFLGAGLSDIGLAPDIVEELYPSITMNEETTNDIVILVIESQFGEYNLSWDVDVVKAKDGVSLDIPSLLPYFSITSATFGFSEFNNLYQLKANSIENTIMAEYKRYEVSFFDKKDGQAYGGETAFASQTVLINDLALDPGTPFRLGYEFIDWLNDADDLSYNFNDEVIEDIVIYADWQNYFATEDALGTEQSPFAIETYEHLQNISLVFSDGFPYYNDYKNKYYKLNNNIEVTPEDDDFVMIKKYFEGTLDGNGYIIKDIVINSTVSNPYYAALIMDSRNGGVVKNLGLSGEVNSGRYAAAFVITNHSIIENCFNYATVTSNDSVSGLIGGIALDNIGAIRNCYNAGDINAPVGKAGGVAYNTYVYSLENTYNIGVSDGVAIAGTDGRINNYTNSDISPSGIPEENMTTLQMLGEDTVYHTNELYAALNISGNEGVWTIIPNEDNKWYYPQLSVFVGNELLKDIISYETIYVVKYEYDDECLTEDSYDFIFDGDLVDEPTDPERILKLFDGWYVVEEGVVTDLFDFDTEIISDDITLRATWVTYRYTYYDEFSIDGIEIANGVEDLTITIPNDIYVIKGGAFVGRQNIVGVLFEQDSSLIAIEDYVFAGTSITTITLPATMLMNGISALTFMDTSMEEVNVEEGGIELISQDGVLYAHDKGDITDLIYYPIEKSDTEYQMPNWLHKIRLGAFVGYENEGNYYGNSYLEKIILSEITLVEYRGLYGMENLTTVVIGTDQPTFTKDATVFSYYDEVAGMDVINPALTIELNDYTAFTQFMADAGWADFEIYYSYPVVITFEYNGGTANYEETVRTRVDGLEENDLILNGMAMGEMPFPHKFGFDFVEWNTDMVGNGDEITATTPITTDLTVYAVWQVWVDITLTHSNETGDILVNGIYYNKTITEIVGIPPIESVHFDNITTDEQIQITQQWIIFTGSLTSTFDGAAILVSQDVMLMIDAQIINDKGIVQITQLNEGESSMTFVVLVLIDKEIGFEQSLTSQTILYSDRAEASLPDPEEYNILTWNDELNIGRNQTTLYYENLIGYHAYTPIAELTITITDTTEDYIYNASEQGVTYETDRDYWDGETPVICDVAYFATEADMLARENEISIPIQVGTYYYVISRTGYNDFCDTDDVEGSYEITQATVTVTGITTLSKVFDGNDEYNQNIVEGVHYQITGIVDGATVTIDTITYNNSDVDYAEYVTVEITISDTHNYSMVSTFTIDAEIIPLEVTVVWTGDDLEYVYNAEDQSSNIEAKFLDVENNENLLFIGYSGQSDVFMTAGSYTLTAVNYDTNYEILDYIRTIEIAKRQVTVEAMAGMVLTKVYDGLSEYPYELVIDEEYTIDGIVDSAAVTIGEKFYNSPDVDFADTITVGITISDTDNYTMAESFDFSAIITPKDVPVIWNEGEWDFVYTANDQSAAVEAMFYDVSDAAIDLQVDFSGQSTEFMTAGEYVASAITTDTNYALQDETRNITIEKAVVEISTIDSAYIYKVFDGNDDYEDDFIEDTHYQVTGIVDDLTVTIENIKFNSSQVYYAVYATYQPVISDTDNYSLAGDFVIAAYIDPLAVDVIWLTQESYVYNYYDQSDEVNAYYEDIYSQQIDLDISFTGEATQFITAGVYYVIASEYDTNYTLNNSIISLEIEKAQITVTALTSLTKVYDGNTMYAPTLVEDEHYKVEGIAEGDDITAVSIQFTVFNSSNVAMANEAASYLALSDTHNYTIATLFTFNASITPKPVQVIWNEGGWDFVYTAEDQYQGVEAIFYNVYDDAVSLQVDFSGQSEVFMTAGDYIATASTTNTNYTLQDYTREITVEKANVIVEGITTISKIFNSSMLYEDIIVEGEHYQVTGIVDSAVVSIGIIFYNSIHVDYAEYVTVGITISDTDNYSMESTFSIDAEILPLEVDVLWAGDDLSYIYTAQDMSSQIQAKYIDVHSDEIQLNIEYSGQSSVFMTAGNYTLTAINYDTNYEILDYTRNVEIGKKEVTVQAIQGVVLTKVYDAGTDYPYGITENEDYIVNGIVDLAFVEIGEKIYNSADVDFADTVTAAITISDTDNYIMASSFELNAQITPMPTAVHWQSDESYVYTGQDFTNTVTAYYNDVNDDNISPTIVFSGQSSVFMTAGYYTLTASTSDTNYELLDYELSLYIDKAQGIITADSLQTHIYDISVKDVVAVLNHSETTLTYSPQQGYENVGEYPINVIADETANYYGDEVLVTLVINKATIDMSDITFEDDSFVYDGNEKSIFIDGALPPQITDVVYYNNSLTDAGERLVTVEFIYDTHNYNVVNNMQATIYITQRPLTIEIDDQQSMYGEEIKTLTCGVTNQVLGDDLGLSLYKEGTMEVGVYAIKGQITNTNYAPTFIDGVYTIYQAVHDMTNISFEDKEVIYDATERSVTLTGALPEGVSVVYSGNKGTLVGQYQGVASFIYDEHNFETIDNMTATLTIVKREITVSFSEYENLIYDATEKTVQATLNNVPGAESGDIFPIIAYDKEVIDPGYYTATVTIDNDNYELVGEASLDFIVYQDKLENDFNGQKDVIAEASQGFLPEATISVVNVSQREIIGDGAFAGSEKRQTFNIQVLNDELSSGEYITMRILIDPDFRYLENLRVGILNANGTITEIESEREGDYLIFNAYDEEATYIIIGDGKGAVEWAVPVVGASAGAVLLSVVGISIRAKRKRKLIQRVTGK